MAEKTEFLQAIDDAILDADSLERFINGSDSETVLTRLSAKYPTLQKALKELFENGGIAGRFKTLSELQTKGASLDDGSYALVADDTHDKNGIYIKKEGAWVASAYDPLKKIKEVKQYVEDGETYFAYDLINDNINWTNGAFFHYQTGAQINGNPSYSISDVVYVKAGLTLFASLTGEGIAGVIETTPEGAFKSVVKVIHGQESVSSMGSEVVEITRDTDAYYRLSTYKNSGFVAVYNKRKTVRATSAPYLTTKTQVSSAGIESGSFRWGVPVKRTLDGLVSYIVDIRKGDIISTQRYDAMLSLQESGESGSDTFWNVMFKDGFYHSDINGKAKIICNANDVVKINGAIVSSLFKSNSISLNSMVRLDNIPTMQRTKTPIRLSKGEAIEITEGVAGVVCIVAFNPVVNTFVDVFSYPYDGGGYNANKPAKWIAPYDTFVFASSKSGTPIYLHKYTKSLHGIGDVDEIELPEKEYVFATAMNYICKLETKSDGIEYIAISEDLGENWNYIQNTLGDIVNYHFFSDGTILLCCPTGVYTTSDYKTLQKSTVYDHDGSVYVPTGRPFFAMQTGDKLDFIGDTEVFAWGDYVADDTIPRIWYTTDLGKTIKCAAKFGTTVIDGKARPIRHVHRVYLHQKTETFYVLTGDHGSGESSECYIMSAKLDVSSDTWTWKVLGQGSEYKFGNIIIDDNDLAYLITDYTEPNLIDKKGIYRVPTRYLGDITKYKMIYHATAAEWGEIAPVNLLLDTNGNKVLLPDYKGSGWVWVATDGLNFKKIHITPSVLLTYTIGENYNGDVYCVEYEPGIRLRLSGGSYNLTRILRSVGVSDFMRGGRMISGMTTAVS